MGYLDSRGLAYFWEKVKAYADDRPYLVKAPVGTIVVWSGTVEDIPTGWALCDGQDGRPDLRGRFVLGAGGTYNPGAAGGSEEVTLTVEQMPTHSHAETISQTGTAAGAATTSRMMGAGAAAQNTSYVGFYSNLGNVRGPEATTLNTGGSKSHPNMPPYYVLCYIIKIAADETDGVTMEQVNDAIQQAIEAIPPGSNIPAGGVIIWTGAADAVPDGWALCDGTNGTPDLRGRFVLGTGGTYNPGDTGGSEEVTLTVEQMPTHRFSYSFRSNGKSNTVSPNGSSYNLMQQDTEGASITTKYTKYLGNSAPHPNMPPYYVLAYIMKL